MSQRKEGPRKLIEKGIQDGTSIINIYYWTGDKTLTLDLGGGDCDSLADLSLDAAIRLSDLLTQMARDAQKHATASEES